MAHTTVKFHQVTRKSPREVLKNRQELLMKNWPEKSFDAIFPTRLDLDQVMNKNCENMIGTVEIPVGVAGPAQTEVEGEKQEIWIPLATTEGALVASVSRGMKLLNESGVVSVIAEKKGMSRAPVFECRDGKTAVAFSKWLETKRDFIAQKAVELSSHLQFLDLFSVIQGRHVFTRFHFDTDEAMGMNMVTISLEKILAELLPSFPDVKLLAISSNLCADKKPSSINTVFGRGWWVQAEQFISNDLLQKNLHTDAKTLSQIHTQKHLIGGHLAGSLSQNTHIANVAAAFYLATGQDIAHTVNASLGSTTIEETNEGLYVAVTLPEVDVGTVGGGTVLKPQAQARQLITQNSSVTITAQLLAATLAVGCLAAELSVLGAIATGQLGGAHQRLARGEQ